MGNIRIDDLPIMEELSSEESRHITGGIRIDVTDDSSKKDSSVKKEKGAGESSRQEGKPFPV